MTIEERFQLAGIEGIEFRGAPFWSWNDDLDPSELRRQIRSMRDAGMGGHFMHARIGLITPYLSEEYIECHRACIEESKALGMKAWLYDEDKWPSGIAGGIVPAKSEDHRIKLLKVTEVQGGSNINTSNFIAAFHLSEDKKYDTASIDEIISASQDSTFAVFCVEVGSYVDLLDPETVRQFIATTHEVFKKSFKSEFGKTIPGIFTDEPNYNNTFRSDTLPWSNRFETEFQERRGYDIASNLISLVYERGDYKKIRYDFWRTALELYVEAFSKQIFDWCEKEGIALTGHQLCEDDLVVQTWVIGAAMPHYEWMQIPGIDHLCRQIADPVRVKQCSSVAHQFGNRRVLSEMFGCSGWNMSFEDQKWIAEWQYVLGVNLMCQHLSLYSLRGCRKRDYPPSVFYQQPWWPEYRMFEDHFARLARALTLGKHVADILLIHPIESAWCVYNPKDHSAARAINDEFVKVTETLCSLQLDHDYGDESIMVRYARISDYKVAIGQAEYSLIILPPMLTIRKSTLNLLKEWIGRGGKVLVVGRYPEMLEGIESKEPENVLRKQLLVENDFDSICRALKTLIEPTIKVKPVAGSRNEDGFAKKVYVHQRDCGEKQLFFLCNIDREQSYDLEVHIKGKGAVFNWNLDNGDISPLYCRAEPEWTIALVKLYPAGSSLLCFEPGAPSYASKPPIPREQHQVPMGKVWDIMTKDPNSLTMDYCRYRIADGEWSDLTPTIWLEGILSDIVEPTPISLIFSFETDFSETKDRHIQLVLETPEKYEIYVNGHKMTYKDNGWWCDISFKTLDIEPYVVTGENIIELRCTYIGNEGRAKLRDALEIEKLLAKMGTNDYDEIQLPFSGEVADKIRLYNELKHGLELESCYLIGDFGVFKLDNGHFVLRDMPNRAEVGDLVNQGFAFFRGKIIYSKTCDIETGENKRIFLSLQKMGAIVAKVKVNGEYAGRIAWQPLELDITDFVKNGSNLIELELFNSCRNLLGPHHHVAGELLAVGPDSFGGECGYIGKAGRDPERDKAVLSSWTHEYSFVETGLTMEPVIRYEIY